MVVCSLTTEQIGVTVPEFCSVTGSSVCPEFCSVTGSSVCLRMNGW